MGNKKLHLTAIACTLAGLGAHAQTAYVRPSYQYPPLPAANGPASVQIPDTPLFVAPYVGVGAGYDDNLFLSSRNEKSSTIYMLSPGLKVDARSAHQVLQLSYQGQFADYGQSPHDNYVDHAVRGQFDTAFDQRNFLRVGLDWIKSHDPRGSTDRPLSDYPDKYEVTTPYAQYAFGAPGAQGRVELYASDANRRYLNNRQFTTTADRDTQEYGGAFYWRAMPKTYVMAEARRTEIDYKHVDPGLSADENRLYLGVTWEATAATSGTLKYGRLERDFKDPTLQDFSGPSWEGLVSWAPRTYSKFDFYTARQTNESTGLGSFILTSIGGVTWTHAWSSVLTTGVDARFQRDAYKGFDRNDDIKSLGFKVGYRFRRWLTLGAEYAHTDRNSNLDQYDYKKNFYLLTATASM
jgi:hypothetical protein